MLTTERRQANKAARDRYEAEYVSTAGPIVIGGCGRSGTTLLRNILDTHSQVCCGPESTLFLGPLLTSDKEQIIRLVADFDMEQAQIEGLIAGSASHAEFMEAFFAAYTAAQGKAIWAEKTPRNVNKLDYIFGHFPRARFVHVIRDARDTVCSLRTHPKFRVVDGRSVETKIRNPINKCVSRWSHDVAEGLKFRDDPRYFEVYYEQLVLEPEETLKGLVEFLELPWEDSLLRFYDVERSSRDTTRFATSPKANQPLTTAAIGRWQKDLSPDELGLVYARAGSLMHDLGYLDGTPVESETRRRLVRPATRLEDLSAGDRVKVAGSLAPDGSFLASTIKRRIPEGSAVIEGRLDRIAPDSLEVMGQTFRLSAAVRVRGPRDEKLAAADLMAASHVRLRGRGSCAQDFNLEKVGVEEANSSLSSLEGEVEAIEASAAAFHLLGFRVRVQASTQFA